MEHEERKETRKGWPAAIRWREGYGVLRLKGKLLGHMLTAVSLPPLCHTKCACNARGSLARR